MKLDNGRFHGLHCGSLRERCVGGRAHSRACNPISSPRFFPLRPLCSSTKSTSLLQDGLVARNPQTQPLEAWSCHRFHLAYSQESCCSLLWAVPSPAANAPRSSRRSRPQACLGPIHSGRPKKPHPTLSERATASTLSLSWGCTPSQNERMEIRDEGLVLLGPNPPPQFMLQRKVGRVWKGRLSPSSPF